MFEGGQRTASLFAPRLEELPSRTGVAIPVVPEIRSAAQIIRPKTTHTVADRIAVTWTVGRDTVVSGSGVIAWGAMALAGPLILLNPIVFLARLRTD